MKRSNPLAGKSGKILSPRSSVWQFFELNRETRRARCRFCEKILAYTGGTTNLRYHLTAAHAMEEFEVIGPSAKVFKPGKLLRTPPKKRGPKVKGDRAQTSSPATTGTTTPTTPVATTPSKVSAMPTETSTTPSHPAPSLPSVRSPLSITVKNVYSRGKSDDREMAISSKLLQMLIQTLQPLSFTESEGFRCYMKFLEPLYRMPAKSILQNNLHAMYEGCKVNLKEMLAKEAPHFSIAYDAWKGSDLEAYTTVTIHYLTSQWERRSYVLGTERISQLKLSGSEIGNIINQLMYEYELPADCLVATVNRQGLLKLPVGGIGTSLVCEAMSCAAEKLEICVLSAFAVPEVKALIEQARKLATYLIYDEDASRIFEEIKESDGVAAKTHLVEDQKGSWIATSEMLFKLATLRDIIEKVYAMDVDTQLLLDDDKWDLIDKLVNSLHILRAALTVMGRDKTGSVSCLLPVVHSILQHCEDANYATNSPMEKFLKTIGKETREKWDLTAILPSSVPMLGALMDPRFKRLKFIADEDKADVLDALKVVLASNIAGIDGEADNSHGSDSQEEVSPFLCLFGGGEDYSEDKQDVNSEISSYMDFPALRHDSCPLDWWRVNKGRFPQLAKLARQFLCVPATAQPMSNIMGGASQMDMKRALLEVESAAPLIFLNHNWTLAQS